MENDNDQLIFGVIFDLLTLNQSHRQLNVSLKRFEEEKKKMPQIFTKLYYWGGVMVYKLPILWLHDSIRWIHLEIVRSQSEDIKGDDPFVLMKALLHLYIGQDGQDIRYYQKTYLNDAIGNCYDLLCKDNSHFSVQPLKLSYHHQSK